MVLTRSASLASLTTEPPPLDAAKALAGRLATELEGLRAAPVVADYTGPVLFEGHAAAQIAHELLSESLSGTPAPKGAEGFESPLARKLGKRILPKELSVVDDPTLANYRGIPLLGHYAADDEGVPPEAVSLIEKGRLRAFVMSRIPSKEIARSNGHGRNGLVGWARGRIGNLILSSSNGLSAAALRARLLRAVREEGLSYGLVVKELELRASASNGQVVPEPELVYRVTPDGKEELVRGATFGPLSVRDLRDILAAGRDAAAHSFAIPSAGGFGVPATVVSPSLLFDDVEVKRRTEPNKRPPLVPKPPVSAAALMPR
jgi:predicted Zn-dependent protease